MPTKEEPDYYQILGVGRNASLDEIKQAYHRLAARFHPDIRPDDPDAEACLRSLNQAYAVLKDPAQRAHYDRWGAWGPPDWRSPGSTAPRMWIAAVVDHFFAVQRQLDGHKPQRGQDLRYTLAINPQESVNGCEARLQYSPEAVVPTVSRQPNDGREATRPLPALSRGGEVRCAGWLLSKLQICNQCARRGRRYYSPMSALRRERIGSDHSHVDHRHPGWGEGGWSHTHSG